MPKKNPNPPPTVCEVCGGLLKQTGRRTADPWPDEDGPLYPVEIYTCSNPNCPASKKGIEYWVEIPSEED